MILVKQDDNATDSVGTITSFEGTPHELILDFVMLQKALKRPKLKVLWELATLMGDDLEVESHVIAERTGSKKSDEEDLKA